MPKRAAGENVLEIAPSTFPTSGPHTACSCPSCSRHPWRGCSACVCVAIKRVSGQRTTGNARVQIRGSRDPGQPHAERRAARLSTSRPADAMPATMSLAPVMGLPPLVASARRSAAGKQLGVTRLSPLRPASMAARIATRKADRCVIVRSSASPSVDWCVDPQTDPNQLSRSAHEQDDATSSWAGCWQSFFS